MQLCNSYGIFFNSIYNPVTERIQLFIKVSFKTNGPRYLQYEFSFLVLKKPLQEIKITGFIIVEHFFKAPNDLENVPHDS